MAILDAFAGGDRDELLLERSRTGLWLCATSIALFGLTDPFLHPGLLVPVYAIKALQFAFIAVYFRIDRKSTRLNSSHIQKSRMPSSA